MTSVPTSPALGGCRIKHGPSRVQKQQLVAGLAQKGQRVVDVRLAYFIRSQALKSPIETTGHDTPFDTLYTSFGRAAIFRYPPSRGDAPVCENFSVGSPQTLSEAERRIVAAWAADCAERVLGLFEAEAREDDGPRAAIARTRAFARGELAVAEGIRRRFAVGGRTRDVSACALSAARAAGQAAAIAHMGAHALGAAAYAAKATGLAEPNRPKAISHEICWQFDRMSRAARAALRKLPPVGENSSGPLGPGLLASGLLGTIIREIQASLADPDHVLPADWQTDREARAKSVQSTTARRALRGSTRT